jgi:hypothetical protein
VTVVTPSLARSGQNSGEKLASFPKVTDILVDLCNSYLILHKPITRPAFSAAGCTEIASSRRGNLGSLAAAEARKTKKMRAENRPQKS